MFNLKNFFHLPVLDTALSQIMQESAPGIILVTGIDTHTADPLESSQNLLTSGRTIFFDSFMQEILVRRPELRAVLIAKEKALTRLPRGLEKRVKVNYCISTNIYIRHITEAARTQPDLLIIDRLDAETLPAIFETAQAGVQILTQMDTILPGAEILYQLLKQGVPEKQLASINWVIHLQHQASLCPHCKRPTLPVRGWFERLRQKYPHLAEQAYAFQGTFFQAPGCAQCKGSGRSGMVSVFDIYQPHLPGQSELLPASLLPIESYRFELAAQGYLAIEDVLNADADQVQKLYQLYSSSQRALNDKSNLLHRKLAELEAANQVLLKRTEVQISLQDTVQMLTSSSDLADLAARVCRRAREMCGAERAILYFLRKPEEGELKAEVLAVSGWSEAFLHQQFNTSLILAPGMRSSPTPLNVAATTGLPASYKDEVTQFHAALQVPLIAQNERIGLMFIHTTHKRAFTPGETSLLQTFANQAALAIQRAGLIEELRLKLAQLETAQAELVGKERLERELELARQVQQNVLPRVFPALPGYSFAAKNEPARQVGGDFYDVIVLDDDHFGVIIADVSDKGMPAALYMALTRSLLLAEARRSCSPLAVLMNVNHLLLELGQSSQFVSVFYGIVDRRTNTLTYARAGHDRPLLVRQKAVMPLGGSGMVLGLFSTHPFFLSEESLILQDGDRLVLYTDGLTDMVSPEGEFYGLEQLIERLRLCCDILPDELCSAIFDDLKAYQGSSEQFDDMTLLVMEYGCERKNE
jgi:sigma-B regulation protein RsbU (phosphoserine phosphatase)